MELAAIASAAVPGLTPTGVAGIPDDAADFESALLVDDSGKQWRVRSPKHPDASMRLETELQALKAFTPAIRAELPFLVPHIAGTLRQGELCTFVYAHLEGSVRELDDLAGGGRELVTELGRMLAAIHDLPPLLVHNADLPSYEANEFRQRKLNELDQAAITGRIPAHLLRRWEHALEDVTLWRFHATVVHGDLHEDNLLVSAGRVSAVTGWTDLRVGDPADDFAWLLAASDPGFAEAVHNAYVAARGEAADPHLMRRAALAAEFALAQWLVRGVAMDNSEMIAEAEDMMSTLDRDLQAEEAAAAAYRAQESQHQADATVAGTDGADMNRADMNRADMNRADRKDPDRGVVEPVQPSDDNPVAGEPLDDDGDDTPGLDDGDPVTSAGTDSPDTDRGAGTESTDTTEKPRRFSVSPVPADDTETSALPIIKSN
ncbi:hypothetical protein GCM10009582_28890 [Arthrobacter flavus]